MPLDPDLLGPQPLTITPADGLTGPRLWVRRLVIWKEPGGEKIRDITLRPGLNIIWSPDGADDNASTSQSDSIGHGGGKTLFCRLIRYCLGEDRFAPAAQRDLIGTTFMNGIVGAEIMLDGTCWAILRPLGVRRRHMAVESGNLDEIATGEGSSTGMEPFINAVDQSIITPAVADLVRSRVEGPAWPVALAWLTRDQECHLNDVLDWRSPASDSDSPLPASGREKGPRLEALRALLKAITPEEQATGAQVSGLEEKRRALELEIGHRRWEISHNLDHLISALGLSDKSLPDMPLLLDVLRKSGAERVAVATKLPVGSKIELADARKRFEEAQAKWARLDSERIRLEASVPIERRLLSQIKGDLPGLSFSAVEADSQICPICEVPIDQALAEKCGLSHKLHDSDTCRARWEKRKQEFNEQEQKLFSLDQGLKQNLVDIALAKQAMDSSHESLAKIEKVRDARETAWYSARRLKDDIERLASIIDKQETAKKELRSKAVKLDTERDRLGSFRDKQALVFGQMSQKFDPIIRRLVGHNAKSHITLSGKGINLTVDMGGDRTTAAIESLKILAFDLAALCRSIEGGTGIPAFFLHDSPREADLGLSIYHELFRLVREIEDQNETDQPLFQYIVTTTTRPPDDYADKPWLCLTLRGSPGNERLLRRDL